ncbi:hypothetical protein [Candidatus Mycobacterium methanotrophicum]|uniref:Secreted protein n=2 Tax=Candidatus Mycobacterium methanotrophicum TaxID=2943498 RepID=A0ABY4QSH2_9MYCO|nr:hypothetical protein [Candidatus Mycobacterium methanotrophicum]UQX12535.1 hypothetical protein M5I08_10100 [Candidatus Mycobacterium methanotrophicum]
MTGAVSAFVTFGLGPLAHAPKARADEFDVVIDQVLNAITASLGDLAGVSGAVPELGSLGAGAADVGSVAAASPADAWLRVLGACHSICVSLGWSIIGPPLGRTEGVFCDQGHASAG